jgi:hypothetical protein
MAERHYVGVYWEDRAASKEDCVSQVGDMLPRLRAYDPLLSRWYLKLGSREETLQAEITEASQHGLLDSGLELVGNGPGLGWKVTLWNGLGDGRSAHVDVVVGADPKILFSPTPNSCLLTLPRGRDIPEVGALLRRKRMTGLLAELARAWQADWGIASTDSYLYGVLPTRPSHHPRVGWLTFLNARRGRAPAIPKTQVTPVDALGYIVATSDDEFSADDGGAIDRVADVEDALDRAKRLQPAGEIPGPDAEGRAPDEPPAAGRTVDDSSDAAPRPETNGAYAAALDAACALDELSARIPARRSDLAEAMLRASTSLVVAVATGDEAASRKVAEVRALVDVTRRLFPETGAAAIERATQAFDRLD